MGQIRSLHWMTYVMTIAIVVMWVLWRVLLAAMVFLNVDPNTAALAGDLLNVQETTNILNNLLMLVVSFWVGSSVGSAIKQDAMIGSLPPPRAPQEPQEGPR
jgi:hypothetical protein